MRQDGTPRPAPWRLEGEALEGGLAWLQPAPWRTIPRMRGAGSTSTRCTVAFRRILVIIGCSGEGPLTIRFADRRRGVPRTATYALGERPEG